MTTDDLVERLARAWRDAADVGNPYASAEAALAVALEEAALVCDPKGDCNEMDKYGEHYAAAIRALIPK